MIIRLSRPSQQIIVSEDGNTSRASYPPVQNAPVAWVRLSRATQSDLDALRNQWCALRPQFGPPKPDEPVYEVGVRCGEFGSEVVAIPISRAPVIITNLLEQVPPPATQ